MVLKTVEKLDNIILPLQTQHCNHCSKDFDSLCFSSPETQRSPITPPDPNTQNAKDFCPHTPQIYKSHKKITKLLLHVCRQIPKTHHCARSLRPYYFWPCSQSQGNQRSSRMNYVRDGIADSLMR